MLLIIAPDIFTAIAGLSADDIPLVLGGLIGASMFIASVVLGSVILASPADSATVDSISFMRDVIVYLIATVIIIILALSKRVALWEASLFLVLYILYVIIVVIHSKIRKAKKRGPTYRASLLPSEAFNNEEDDNNNNTLNNSVSLQSIGGGVTEFMSLASDPEEYKNQLLNQDNNNNGSHILPTENNSSIDPLDIGIRTLLHELVSEEESEEENNPNFIIGISWQTSECSFINRIQYCIELPFSILRWLSSPPADGKW